MPMQVLQPDAGEHNNHDPRHLRHSYMSDDRPFLPQEGIEAAICGVAPPPGVVLERFDGPPHHSGRGSYGISTIVSHWAKPL
jgi:hypothetical protein